MFIIRNWRTVIRAGWKNLIRTRKGKALIVAGILVAILVVSLVGFEVTSLPIFCSSCHNMKPYYESWKVSSHNEVNCIKCHSDPGLVPYLKTKANGLVEVGIYL
ncbi:NapC/NirT family cytochrome c, partial [Candidatus Aerophobetes bacterium]|nr:NapC/NirT family cytochrome c [Candidatus Aerophobetes bacterium]